MRDDPVATGRYPGDHESLTLLMIYGDDDEDDVGDDDDDDKDASMEKKLDVRVNRK